MKPKFEMMLATWPDKVDNEHFGDRGYGRGDTSCSAWLSLRSIVREDKYAYRDVAARVVDSVGIRVWVSNEGTISLDLKLHDVHSMSELECGVHYKVLKALRAKTTKRYPMLDNFERNSNVHDELVKLFAAMGVTTAVQYRGAGVPEAFINVSIAIRAIAETLQAAVDRMAGRVQRQTEEEAV